MEKKIKDDSQVVYKAWFIDQLAKSAFFHQKLHEWQLIEIAEQIEQIKGEHLDWALDEFSISKSAWNKVIHRGIKPILVFAHPEILKQINGSTAYYRMLSMVSQKSMSQVGSAVTAFEQGNRLPNEAAAIKLANHFNRIISHLIEADETINAKEFDLWRGMAAGSQAQGSWQNMKGQQAEILLKGLLEKRLKSENLIVEIGEKSILLNDGRVVKFSSEPDLAIFSNEKIEIAIEIKGGIDGAGVLERIGAALKSLKRAKAENSDSITILIMQEVSFSATAQKDIDRNRDAISHFFMLERLIDDETERLRFFGLLRI